MKRNMMTLILLAGTLLIAGALGDKRGQAGPPGDDESRIGQGFAIAPVLLNLERKNRSLVGLGSYLVNATATCADCHSCPTYAPGHSPYEGGDGQLNSVNYLAGGVDFGFGIISANITPDAQGRPAGLTLEEFTNLLRTGEDPDNPGQVLQVMPWPILGKMTDRDIRAIYEYLSSIPYAEPGACFFPGQ
jgi:cytochrome c553